MSKGLISSAELTTWLRGRGFEAGYAWMKFERGPEPPLDAETALDVRLAGPDDAGALVEKQFTTIAGRTFLIESVQYGGIREELLKLPECGADSASLQKGGKAKKPAPGRDWFGLNKKK